MSKFFKGRGKKAAEVTAPEPRSLEDITKSYQELLSRAAQAQYLVYVHNQDLEQLNRQLVAVNQEAAARQALDKAAAPASTEETTNVES